MTKYLHTMIRVSSLEDTIAFFEVLGLREIRRRPDEKGRYTNVFLAAPGDEAAAVELTYNWDPEPYTGGGEEHVGVAALLVRTAADLAQAQHLEEGDGVLQRANADHRVQIFSHRVSSGSRVRGGAAEDR